MFPGGPFGGEPRFRLIGPGVGEPTGRARWEPTA
jgi:hypothetical protein